MIHLVSASLVVLAGMSAANYFTYRLYGRPFFLWISAAWATNAAYVSLEAYRISTAPASPGGTGPYLASLLSTACFWLAHYEACDRVPSRGRRILQMAVGTAIVLIAIVMTGRLGLSQEKTFAVAVLPGILFTSAALFVLAWQYWRRDPPDLLTLLRGTTSSPLVETQDQPRGGAKQLTVPPAPYGQGAAASVSPRSSSISQVSIPPVVPSSTQVGAGGLSSPSRSPVLEETIRKLRVSRLLSCSTFAFYGLLQFAYLFKHAFGATTLFSGVYWVALVLKAGNGLALPFLWIADFRDTSEILRHRSLAEELGVLTASVEHDIRHPLSSMATALEIIRREYQHEGPLLSRLRELEKQRTRILASVSVIPALRETDEYYRKRFRKENLVDIARAAAKDVRAAFALTRKIEVNSTQHSIPVLAFRERLLQAFVNIMNNAVEACVAKDPDSPPDVSVTCSVSEDGQLAIVRVRDSGVGILPENMPLVVRPLFSTKTGANANRGLGLFTAARFVGHHQGTVSFSSDGASYTEVLVALPIHLDR